MCDVVWWDEHVVTVEVTPGAPACPQHTRAPCFLSQQKPFCLRLWYIWWSSKSSCLSVGLTQWGELVSSEFSWPCMCDHGSEKNSSDYRGYISYLMSLIENINTTRAAAFLKQTPLIPTNLPENCRGKSALVTWRELYTFTDYFKTMVSYHPHLWGARNHQTPG